MVRQYIRCNLLFPRKRCRPGCGVIRPKRDAADIGRGIDSGLVDGRLCLSR